MTVRPAAEADAPAIGAVHDHRVLHTLATFDLVPPTPSTGVPGSPTMQALAVVAQPNEASVALHRALGFTHVGTFGEVGRTFGRYVDVAWFQKDL